MISSAGMSASELENRFGRGGRVTSTCWDHVTSWLLWCQLSWIVLEKAPSNHSVVVVHFQNLFLWSVTTYDVHQRRLALVLKSLSLALGFIIKTRSSAVAEAARRFMSLNISLNHSKSLEVTGNSTIQQIAYEFLLASIAISYHFPDKVRHWSKIAIFSYPLHSTSRWRDPRQNIAVTFGIEKPERWSYTRTWKTLSRFDTMTALTDWHADGQTSCHGIVQSSAR